MIFQYVRNQFRDFDRGSLFAWRITRALTAVSALDIILVMVTPDSYAYPIFCSFYQTLLHNILNKTPPRILEQIYPSYQRHNANGPVYHWLHALF